MTCPRTVTATVTATLPPRRPLRRLLLAAVAAAVLAGTVACTGTDQSTGGDMAMGPSAAAVDDPAPGAAEKDAPAQSSAAASSAAGSASAAPSQPKDADGKPSGGTPSGGESPRQPATPPVLDGRQIIRTGSFTLSLSVPQTDDAEADQKALAAKINETVIKARAAATGAGGFVSASEGDAKTQSITLRVPVAQYDAVRAALAGLGPMTGSENSEDVTANLADMEGRIATMKKAIERIRALLANAQRVQDIIAIESELSQREAELEGILRQQAAMKDKAALSTITVVVSGSIVSGPAVKRPAVPDVRMANLVLAKPGGFTGGLLGATDELKAIGAALLTVAGALLPILPIALVLAAGVLWWIRWRRRVNPAPRLQPTSYLPPPPGFPAPGQPAPNHQGTPAQHR